MELSVHVLTPTFWPLQAMGGQEEQQNTCTYPQEIEELREAFTKFYLNRHSGRKLQWQANMVGGPYHYLKRKYEAYPRSGNGGRQSSL